MKAVADGSLDRVERLIAQGADLEALGPKGETVVFTAVAHMRLQRRDGRILRALLSAGCDLGARMPDGKTPLHFAATLGDSEIVRVLLEGGAPPDQPLRGAEKPLEGFTPLMLAASGGHEDVGAALLEGGARVDARSETGTTALMVAAAYGYPGFVALLLERGADRAVKSRRGKTALEMARGSETAALLRGGARSARSRVRPADAVAGSFVFRPAGCGYSAVFPFRPERAQESRRTPYGMLTRHRASVEGADLGHYAADCLPLPDKERARVSEQIVRRILEGELREKGLKLVSFQYRETAGEKIALAHGRRDAPRHADAYNVQRARYYGYGSQFSMSVGWKGAGPNPFQVRFLESLKPAR